MPTDISPITTTEVKKIQCAHCGSWHRAISSGSHYTDYFDCPSCSGSFAWTWGETGNQSAQDLSVHSRWKKACKACGFQFAAQTDLCPCCGIYRSRAKGNDYEKMWEDLMGQSLKRHQHEEFILNCINRGQIVWVRRKYEEVYKLTNLEFFGGLLQFVREHAPVPRTSGRHEWNLEQFMENSGIELKTFILGFVRQARLWWRSLDRVHQRPPKD